MSLVNRSRCALLLLLGCGTLPPDSGETSALERDPLLPLLRAVPLAQAGVAPEVAPAPSPDRQEVYRAVTPKSVLDAQLYSVSQSREFVTPDGRQGVATLHDLAPAIHVWSVLHLSWADGHTQTWHLENPSGLAAPMQLHEDAPTGLLISRGGVDRLCDLWGPQPSPLDLALATGLAYAPLCGGAVALRNAVEGSRSRLEWTTDLLRDHVWGGEQITQMVKQTFFADSEHQTAELTPDRVSSPVFDKGPQPALLGEGVVGRLIPPVGLGLTLDQTEDGHVVVGAWYPLHAVPGAWVSVMQPRFVDAELKTRGASELKDLDSVEGPAMVYTVAFDLSDFELGYEVGTDHPRVDWSPHAGAGVRAPGLAGPDGYGDLRPLARTGALDPAYVTQLVALFVGGFKRAQGALREGVLADINGGSHYGFVQYGTELSRLQPGLATLVVWADQRVEMLTWTEADNSRLWQVRHARQNGVALVQTDPDTGLAQPGPLVDDWRQGNWSGSAEGALRSVRGGLCIQESDAGRFLLYSYFSSATPSAMALVYMSYQCQSAMLLDMNALEHTYMAVHVHEGGELAVQQLVQGMEVLDRQKAGGTYPRFVGYADNRDFFYLTQK